MRHDRRGGGGHGRQDRRRPDYSAMTEYYDDKGRLRREVFIDWPQALAENLRISRTNLRRAYDYVSAMRFRIQAGKEDSTKVIQEGMGRLLRFVQYQAGRERAWEEAKNFFESQVKAVLNKGDVKQFEGFYELFQSTMAYLRR